MVDHGGSLGILQPLQWQLRCWAPNCWKDALRRVPSRWQGVPKLLNECMSWSPLFPTVGPAIDMSCGMRMGPSRTIAPKKQYGHVLRWLDDGYCHTCSLKACFQKWCCNVWAHTQGFKHCGRTSVAGREIPGANFVGEVQLKQCVPWHLQHVLVLQNLVQSAVGGPILYNGSLLMFRWLRSHSMTTCAFDLQKQVLHWFQVLPATQGE